MCGLPVARQRAGEVSRTSSYNTNTVSLHSYGRFGDPGVQLEEGRFMDSNAVPECDLSFSTDL